MTKNDPIWRLSTAKQIQKTTVCAKNGCMLSGKHVSTYIG